MPVPKPTTTAKKPSSTTKAVPAAKAKPASKTAAVAKAPLAKKADAKAPLAKKADAKAPVPKKPDAKAKKPNVSSKQPVAAAPTPGSKANYGSCCYSPPKKETTAKKQSALKKKTSYPTGMCYFSDTESGSESSFDGCPLLPSQMRMLISKKSMTSSKVTAAKKSVSVGATYYYSDTYSDDYDCDGGSCSMSRKK